MRFYPWFSLFRAVLIIIYHELLSFCSHQSELVLSSWFLLWVLQITFRIHDSSRWVKLLNDTHTFVRCGSVYYLSAGDTSPILYVSFSFPILWSLCMHRAHVYLESSCLFFSLQFNFYFIMATATMHGRISYRRRLKAACCGFSGSISELHSKMVQDQAAHHLSQVSVASVSYNISTWKKSMLWNPISFCSAPSSIWITSPNPASKALPRAKHISRFSTSKWPSWPRRVTRYVSHTKKKGVLIFTDWPFTQWTVEFYLINLGFNLFVVWSQYDTQRRKGIFDNADHWCWIPISISSKSSTAINLQKTCFEVIFFDALTNAKKTLQAADWVFRWGQIQKVCFHDSHRRLYLRSNASDTRRSKKWLASSQGQVRWKNIEDIIAQVKLRED